MNALRVSPRQAFEIGRLLDRTGDGIVYAHGEIVTVLVDVYGTGSPNLALELDQDGEVIARQVLSLHRRDADDGLEDFGEEQPLPGPVDLSHARPAPVCECGDHALGHEGSCVVCGRALMADVT